jgi:hypothetical protein
MATLHRDFEIIALPLTAPQSTRNDNCIALQL